MAFFGFFGGAWVFLALGILDFVLGMLEFPASLRGSKATEAISINSKFILKNSKIPYYVILGLNPRISIENSKFFVMRS